MNISTEGGFKVGNNDTKALLFGLGGYGSNYFNNYTTLYGYNYFSLSGNSFVKVASTLDYEFVDNHHFNFSANFAKITHFRNSFIEFCSDFDEILSEFRRYFRKC